MKRKIRWKKNPPPTGLAAVCSGPVSHKLHDGEQEFATVRAMRSRHTVTGWMWSCPTNKDLGIPWHNTADSPKPTIEEAKAEAVAFIKSHLDKLL